MTTASQQKPLAGGCQCGAVRYEITRSPTDLFICHCRECRKQSASAFGISVFVPREGFRLTKGVTRRWTRATDSGRTLHCEFCQNCGSRLWHESAQDDIVSVKGGSLDEAVDVSEAIHVWTSRKLPGVLIPEHAAQFGEEPDGD